METSTAKAGRYEFHYNPSTTEVYVSQQGAEWEIEIYQHKHYQGALEIDPQGQLILVEEFGLKLEKCGDFSILIK